MTTTVNAMESIAPRVAFGETLVELADLYPDLLLLDGDLANSTRADILHQARPDRFLEMGIAEQNLVGVAAGLATLGFIPWVSSFAAFIASRALDQIRVVVAQPGLNVKLAGGYSGLLTGSTGKTHQSVDDIAIFRAMPHMTVVAPADAVEARAAMYALMEHYGPAYLRRKPGGHAARPSLRSRPRLCYARGVRRDDHRDRRPDDTRAGGGRHPVGRWSVDTRAARADDQASRYSGDRAGGGAHG